MRLIKHLLYFFFSECRKALDYRKCKGEWINGEWAIGNRVWGNWDGTMGNGAGQWGMGMGQVGRLYYAGTVCWIHR